jgi:predicted metal-dependent peptidase
MASDWVGIAETTTRDYLRDVENDITRNRKLLAMLQARGRITFNHSGTDMDWKIRFKRAIPKGYADMDTVTFPRRNRHKTAVLGYRGYNSVSRSRSSTS